MIGSRGKAQRLPFPQDPAAFRLGPRCKSQEQQTRPEAGAPAGPVEYETPEAKTRF